MTSTQTRLISFFALAVLLSLGSGCAVPQPRGGGKYHRIKEPSTGTVYHLYLPVDYVRNEGRHPHSPERRKWPLVMTFHGMKPYDNARPQEREWEKEADSYGYIVCAPELKTSDSFMEYPLTKEWSYVLKDRDNVLAIMRHVFDNFKADKDNVLSTSWSCGGYLAHYFPNRYPDKFSCIATRLSNFSAKLLIEETVPQYKNKTSVGIFIGDGDLPACKDESQEAVAWYLARGFKNVEGYMIKNMGHRRIPQTAAAFFARQMGLKPLHQAEANKTIQKVTMRNYRPPDRLIARMSAGGLGSTVVASATSGDTPSKPISASQNARLPESDRRVVGSETSQVTPRRNANRRKVSVSTEPPPRPQLRQSRKPRTIDLARNNPTPQRSPNNRPPVSKPDNQLANATVARRKSTPTRVQQPPARTPTRPDRDSTTSARSRPATAPTTKNAPASKRIERPRIRRDKDDGLSNRIPIARRGTNRRTGASSRTRTPSRAAQEPRTNRARKVDIKIHGPTAGRSPFMLTYSVDLPSDVIDTADFLWKDNGVWMDDRSHGVKFIHTPGVHKITVLMITKNNMEYRGTTNIRVLPEDRTAHNDG